VAEREGFESTTQILPTTLANFCHYHQCYQSLAIVAHVHFTSIVGKINTSRFGSNGSRFLLAKRLRYGQSACHRPTPRAQLRLPAACPSSKLHAPRVATQTRGSLVASACHGETVASRRILTVTHDSPKALRHGASYDLRSTTTRDWCSLEWSREAQLRTPRFRIPGAQFCSDLTCQGFP